MAGNSIITLIKSEKTVFRTDDLAVAWGIDDTNYLKTKIHRLVVRGDLIALRNGIYALTETYDRYEAANILVRPSYVSLQTVLAHAGALFQYDAAITSVAQRSTTYMIGEQLFIYRKIKDDIFAQRAGLVVTKTTTAATPERALLDWFYLERHVSIDNIRAINKERCLALLPRYRNKAMERRVHTLFHHHYA